MIYFLMRLESNSQKEYKENKIMGEIDKDVPDAVEKTTALAIKIVCQEVCDILLEKNRCYGDSAINPIKVFSKVDNIEQINVRLDDKISRLMKGSAYANEDTELDLLGYLVLKRVARRLAENEDNRFNSGDTEVEHVGGSKDNVLETGFRTPGYLARREGRVCECSEGRTTLGTEDQEYLPPSQRTVYRHLNSGERD